VELNQGVWYPQGGIYQIARAYRRLAEELGVEIHTESRVTRIDVQNGAVCGVTLANGERLPAQAIVANVDVTTVYHDLLPPDVAPDPIPLFFFALALGILYLRTHRISAPITLHVALNGTSLALAWLALS